jgi:bacillithiol system protein YtxJ
MNWIELKHKNQLLSLLNESKNKPALICSVSRTVLDRLERNWQESDTLKVTPYFLDLLSFRDISNQIAAEFEVEHESPQVILVHDGSVKFHTSHFGIDYHTLKEAVNRALTLRN